MAQVNEESHEDLNSMIESFRMVAEIEKIDPNDESRMVYGYASVVELNGEPVVDRQGDVIGEAELVKAAHNFMRQYRDGKNMHKGDATGDIVESIVLTKDVQKALNINLDTVGWFIGYHVSDDATWELVKSGELKAFSIGGKAIREAINEEE